MIAQIKGTVLESTPLLVVLEAAGVGYEVHIPITTAEKVVRDRCRVQPFYPQRLP
jgi:Holliday junction DNA helicase RuvA